MRCKLSKIVMTMLLVFCMSISIFAVNVNAEDSNATDKIDNHERVWKEYSAEQATKYLAGENTYPKLDGYLFSGWYTEKACTSAAALRGEEPTGTVYALFVPEHVLSIKAQVSAHLIDDEVTSDDDTASIRFVTTVDSLLYQKVGFEVTYIGKDGTLKYSFSETSTVYERLFITGTDKEWEEKPSDSFCRLSEYFRAYTITGVPSSYYNTEFNVKPYWITMDGDKVYGVEAVKTIAEGCVREQVWVSSEEASNPQDAINYGSYEYPYETLDYAIAHVEDGGIVHVKDNLTIAAGTAWNAHDKNVTITGDDKDEVVEKLIYTADAGFDICINDGVTFTDIEWILPTGFTIRMFAQGHKLVIKDDVTFTNEAATVQLFGGSNISAVESTHLEVYAGTYSAIFGGSDTKDVLGDTNVIVGGKVNSGITATEHNKSHILFGAGWKGTVYGNTNVEVQTGAKFNYVFGGGDNAAAVVKGSTNVSFAGEAMAIYGGSASGVNADTHVIMTDGYVEQIFGGSESNSMTGNTDVQILGGTVARRIYGGCYNNFTKSGWANTINAVTGYTSVTFGPGVDGKYATLETGYKDDSEVSDWLGIDDATYYAVSRLGSNYSSENGKETGVFIVNDYNVESNSYVDRAGYTDFMDNLLVASSVEPYHYLVNATDGGEVYSAGDCIYIVPDKTDSAKYAATVTIGGEIVHYTEEASYYPLPDLTSSTETIVVTFGDVTSAKTEAQTEFIGSAKATIGTAYYATEAQAVAAAEHMKDAVITLTENATEKLASITIVDSKNGTVTTDKKNCIAGETVTLTVTPDEGYNLTGLDVKKDGETVDVGITTTFAGGEYVFTPEAGTYTVQATFERKIFAEKTGWDVTTQYDGKVTLNSGRTGNSQWLDLYDTYGDIDITLTVRDCIGVIDGKPEVSSVIKLTFGDKFAAFRIGCLKKDSTQNSADVYKVQSYGGSGSLYSWNDCGTLTTEEVAAYQSEQGLKFRLVRSGTDVFLYVGDRRVCEAFDLRYTHAGAETYITAATKATVSIKQDGNLDSTDNPFPIEIPFELSTVAPEKVTIALPTCENGSFNTEFKKYLAGDSVKLTVNGDSGYYYDSLSINEEDIIVDWDGTHTFEAEEYYYKVAGSFAPEIFNASTGTNWNLINQNVGVLKPTGTVDTGYMETKENYSVVSITLKNEKRSVSPFSLGTRLDFENGKYLSVQIYGSAGGRYVLKSCHGPALYGNGNEYYVLTQNQVTALETTGLDFKMVRSGTNLMFYLAGERLTELKVNGTVVDCLDLTHDYVADDGKTFLETPVSSGVDENTKAIFKINSWKTPIEIPFTLSNDVPAIVSFDSSQSTNGTVSSNLGVCLVGDTVTLTATPNEGYDCTGLVIDGTDVTKDAVVNADGTCTYTFKTTKESYTVEPICKQKVIINIDENITNGTVVAGSTNYYIGDEVTLIVAGNTGEATDYTDDYYYNSLTINDEEVMVKNDGTYTFTATESVYNVNGSFAQSNFQTGNLNWNLTNQHKGVVSIPAINGNTGWLHTSTDTYRDIAVTVRDHKTSAVFKMEITFTFTNGETYKVRVDNEAADVGYRIQDLDGTINVSTGNKWANAHTLEDDEVAKLQSEEGIEFRVAFVGTYVKIYLDGVEVNSYDVSSKVTTQTARISMRMYGNSGVKDIDVPFTIGGEPVSASIDMSGVVLEDVDGNSLGTIQGVDTTDETGATVQDVGTMSYIVGQKVVLKVTPADGYYHNLKVNGEPVVLDWETMTYSFIAQEKNVITGTFDKGIFGTSNSWNLLNQNAGCLVANYKYVDGDDDSGWLYANDDYQEISTIVKDYTGGTAKHFAVVLKLTFSNNKYVAFRLYGNDGDYMVQSFDRGIYGWGKSYELDSTIDNKIKGNDGVVFKMALRDTGGSKWLDIWVDDVDTPLDSLELTAKDSSITTSTIVSSAAIRHYNNTISDNYLVEVPFTLAKVQPTTVSVSETENGTVTVNSAVNYIGDVVVLAATSKEGYA